MSEGSENLGRGLHGVCNVGVGVGRAHKARFVKRGGDVHPAVEQAVKEAVETRAVGGHDSAVVLGQFVHQEEAEHAALAVHAEGHTRGVR